MPTYWEAKRPDFVLPQLAQSYQELFPPAKQNFNQGRQQKEKLNTTLVVLIKIHIDPYYVILQSGSIRIMQAATY